MRGAFAIRLQFHFCRIDRGRHASATAVLITSDNATTLHEPRARTARRYIVDSLAVIACSQAPKNPKHAGVNPRVQLGHHRYRRLNMQGNPDSPSAGVGSAGYRGLAPVAG